MPGGGISSLAAEREKRLSFADLAQWLGCVIRFGFGATKKDRTNVMPRAYLSPWRYIVPYCGMGETAFRC